MKITNVDIKNYRNLDGVKVSFDENCNFVVGENNIGKSNFLTLLKSLFTAKRFSFEDFKDPTVAIEVNFQLQLSTVEIGQFDDLFSVANIQSINIVAKQDNADEYINYSHLETGTYIPSSSVRNINFIHYDSLRNPIAEITFDKGKGVGKFLKEIVSQYIDSSGIAASDVLEETQVQSLADDVNTTLSQIKAFREFGINAVRDDNLTDLLTKLLTLKDSKGDHLSKSGYGVQFLLLVTLSILERLQYIKQQRGDRGIYVDPTTGAKSISIILGLDEPEIHLHPYMQRSLIRYLNTVINNGDSSFNLLIKKLFDVDKFEGQIIVITHSPNIILNDYKQIIRFIEKAGVISAVSGSDIVLPPKLHKHLQAHFPLIKEAFFSRCVILVEGVTELGCLSHFGRTLGIEFDDLGICVIGAGGTGSVPKLIEVLDKFSVKCIAIIDKDDNIAPLPFSNMFETGLRDFEAEIVSIIDSGRESSLRAIAKLEQSNIENETLDLTKMNTIAIKHTLISSPISVGIRLADIAHTDLLNLKIFYTTWFTTNKTILLGMLIGENLKADEIPNVYKSLLANAKTIAETI